MLIFVRHGKAESNVLGILNDDVEGYPLTKDGAEKIKLIAKELKKLKVNKIISSPIQRARETSQIIGKELGLDYSMDKRLTERYFGKIDNKPIDDGRWAYRIDFEKENVETNSSIEKRMWNFVNSLKDEKGIIVVVTHDPCIKVFLGFALDIDAFLIQGLKIDNGNMSAMKIVGKGKCEIITLNFPMLNKEAVSRINKAAKS